MHTLSIFYDKLSDTSYLAMLVALAAVIIGPLTQISIAQKELRIETRSKNRHIWITNFREYLSQYIADLTMFKTSIEAARTIKHPELRPQIFNNINESSKNIFINQNRIMLMLNIKEKKHDHLLTLLYEMASVINIGETYDEYGKMTFSNDKYDAIKMKVINQSQEILKDEWEKVKTGK